MRCRYRLTGPLVGKSGKYGNYRFVDGVTGWERRPEKDWERLDRLMGRFYQAKRETEGNDDGGTEGQVHRDVLEEGQGAEKSDAPKGNGHAEAEAGDPGRAPAEESGQERTEGSMTLAQAMDCLDHGSDEDWEKSGKPAIMRLRRLTGQKITRGEVDQSFPWITRGYLAAHAAENG